MDWMGSFSIETHAWSAKGQTLLSNGYIYGCIDHAPFIFSDGCLFNFCLNPTLPLSFYLVFFKFIFTWPSFMTLTLIDELICLHQLFDKWYESMMPWPCVLRWAYWSWHFGFDLLTLKLKSLALVLVLPCWPIQPSRSGP